MASPATASPRSIGALAATLPSTMALPARSSCVNAPGAQKPEVPATHDSSATGAAGWSTTAAAARTTPTHCEPSVVRARLSPLASTKACGCSTVPASTRPLPEAASSCSVVDVGSTSVAVPPDLASVSSW